MFDFGKIYQHTLFLECFKPGLGLVQTTHSERQVIGIGVGYSKLEQFFGRGNNCLIPEELHKSSQNPSDVILDGVETKIEIKERSTLCTIKAAKWNLWLQLHF